MRFAWHFLLYNLISYHQITALAPLKTESIRRVDYISPEGDLELGKHSRNYDK